MAGEATVGSILGYLYLDRSDWDAELNAAGRKADELAQHNPDIRIRTNAPSAIAQLSAVAAATKRLQDAQGAEAVAEARLQSLRDRGVTDAGRLRAAEEGVAKARRSQAAAVIALAAAQDVGSGAAAKAAADTDTLAKKSDDAKKSTLTLVQALALVAPAAVPIAAVGVGALAGLAASGGTALLAVLGIKDAMKQGTPIGRQYAAGMQTLNGEFTTLKQLASTGTLSGFNSAIKSLQPIFPVVNRDVAVMSTQLGQVASHIAPALASVFTQLNPLFVTFGNDVVHGAESFQHWAQSSGAVGRFVAYVQANLPTVEATLGNLVSTAMHVAEAFAPFGSLVLDVLRAVSAAIDAIPVPVLEVAVPLLAGLAVAYKSVTLASAGAASIAAASGKMATAGGIAARSAGAVGMLGRAVGFLGPVGIAAGAGLAIASLFMGSNSKAAQEDAARVNALTQAILNNNSAVQLQANLQANGAAAAGRQYGLTVSDLANAVMRSGNAYRTVTGQMQTLRDQQTYLQADLLKQTSGSASYTAVANQLGTVTSSLNKLSGGYKQAEADYAKAKAAAAAQASAVNDVALANEINNGSMVKAAAALGMTTDQYINARIAADKNKQSTDAQTQAFVYENNAAGLVNQALATMAGQNLNNSQAQTAMEQATLSAISTLKQNRGALSENTTAGLADRQAIEGAVSAIRAKMTAEAQATGSTEKATAQYRNNADALLDQIGKLDGTKSAAYLYAKQLLAIPPVVKTRADLQVDAAKRALARINAIAAELRGLNNKTFRTFLEVQTNVKNAQMMAALDRGGHAAGTPSSAPGWFWVGERGPELMRFRGGEQVMPHSVSMRYAQTRAASAPATAASSTTHQTVVINPRANQSESEIGKAASIELAWMAAVGGM